MTAQLPAGLKLTTTDKVGLQPLIKMCVFGRSKVGKTFLATTTGAPEATLIVSAEPGLVTLGHTNLPLVQVQTLREITELCGWIRQQHYRWVIVDSISEIAEVCLESELAKPGKYGKKRHGQEAYGDMANLVRPVIRALRDLPLNVVMLAKLDEIEHSEGEGRDKRIWYTYRPLVPGKVLTKWLPHALDLILALRVFDGKPDERGQPTVYRNLQTVPHQGFEVGFRSPDPHKPALDAYEQPNLALIERKMLASANQPRRDGATQTRTQ